MHARKIATNCRVIQEAHISDSVWSCESVRQFRKSALDTLFSHLEKQFTKNLHDEIFHSLDRILDEERQNKTDLDWGSVHHVLYGMCT